MEALCIRAVMQPLYQHWESGIRYTDWAAGSGPVSADLHCLCRRTGAQASRILYKEKRNENEIHFKKKPDGFISCSFAF